MTSTPEVDFAHTLSQALQSAHTAQKPETELPEYDFRDADRTAADLGAYGCPVSFRMGTGASVFASALLPALMAARREILLVTCFWAPSKSLSGLSEALARLADMRIRGSSFSSSSPESPESLAPSGPSPPLRVRICLSSRSILQKLMHTTSRNGYTYPPSSWASQLGLPPAEVLEAAGIDLVVKSLFFLPFSVMHPKYVIVDRQRAFLPSCNVSWEAWLEACVEIVGDAVRPLLDFHGRTWGDDLPSLLGVPESPRLSEPAPESARPEPSHEQDQKPQPDEAPVHAPGSPVTFSPLDVDGPGSIVVRFAYAPPGIPTVLLPSSHHRNPSFRPFPWQTTPPPPPTPLNLALLTLLACARRHIFLLTPNLTAEAVVGALLGALDRGVNVSLVTSQGIMVLEQLVTAGTTTARCVRAFVQRYEKQQQQRQRRGRGISGRLCISYFRPLRPSSGTSDEEQALLSSSATASSRQKRNASGFLVDTDQPVHSHAKLTIVDERYTVLGSGNLDRASWFTSQELGILLDDTVFAASVQQAVHRVLDGRLESWYEAQSQQLG